MASSPLASTHHLRLFPNSTVPFENWKEYLTPDLVFSTFSSKPWAASIVCFLVLVVSLDYLTYAKQRFALPSGVKIVGDAPYLWRRLRWTENEKSLRTVLQRGYDTYSKQGKAWAYWGQHDDFILVTPPKVADEVKNVDVSRLSFLQAVEDSYHFRLHSNILGRAHVDAVRVSVNKNMNHLHKAVIAQADVIIPSVLGPYAKTTEPFPAFMTLWHLVHTISASFLIGPEFSSNPAYMKQIESYCLDIPGFVHQYFWVPAPLRRLFWYLSPQGFKVRSTIKKLKTFIIPEIRRSLEHWRKTGHTRENGEYTLLGAMLDLKEERGQFSRKGPKEGEEKEIMTFGDEVMFTAFDSAGPIACLVAQMLFESIHHGDGFIKILRDEIQHALMANNGEWTAEMMNGGLPRLESFTRETLRVDGPTLFSVTRSVMQPIKLNAAGGLPVPKGTIISSPAWFVHNDKDIYGPDADRFDPWRFYDEKTGTATTKATTASNTFLAYGYGAQMCPGRYLGIRMTQILFAKILMGYDLEFEDGGGKPDNLFMPGQILPQYLARVKLRERRR